jgi:hypothetical protein
MYLQLMYLQSRIYKNIPVRFDFIATSNQGVFLCLPCILIKLCSENSTNYGINGKYIVQSNRPQMTIK